MASFSIFNSSGEYVGDVYSNDGGISPSLIKKLINSIVTSILVIFVMFESHIGFFQEVNSDNISSNFPALAASCGVIVFSFLISNAYNVSLLFATLKAAFLIVPLALKAGEGNSVLGFILTAIPWLFTMVLIALGAIPAFLIKLFVPASLINALFLSMETMPASTVIVALTAIMLVWFFSKVIF